MHTENSRNPHSAQGKNGIRENRGDRADEREDTPGGGEDGRTAGGTAKARSADEGWRRCGEQEETGRRKVRRRRSEMRATAREGGCGQNGGAEFSRNGCNARKKEVK